MQQGPRKPPPIPLPVTPLFERIEALWHQYRDEEHDAWDARMESTGEAGPTWDDYKAVFKRFPSFPDWLREHGHLG